MKLSACMLPVMQGTMVVAKIQLPQAIDQFLSPGEPIPHRAGVQTITYDIELFFKLGLFWLRFQLDDSERIHWDCAMSWEDMLNGMSVFRFLDLWELSNSPLPIVPIEIQSQ